MTGLEDLTVRYQRQGLSPGSYLKSRSTHRRVIPDDSMADDPFVLL